MVSAVDYQLDVNPRRILKPRRARGLQITPFNSNGWKPKYIVKDEIGEFYISTGSAGVTLLDLFNGERTVAELQQALAEQFNVEFTVERIESFVDLCNRSNLLVPGSWVDVDPADRARARKKRLGSRLGFYKHLIGADRLLDWLMSYQAWWYNRLTGAMVVALMLAGLLFALFPPEQAGLAAPINQIYLTAADLYLTLLPLVFLLEISLHELAHSLACRVFGARSGGFGFGLIWGVVPVFFTKTTDAYTIDNKYQRMMISAAGPMVDLAFLGLSALVVWLSPAGSELYRFALAYTAFPLSVLLINLNPFLIRMDGYWILADLLEQPNLRSASLRYLAAGIRSRLGRNEKDDPLNEPLLAYGWQRHVYTLYGLVAFTWTVTFVGLFLLSLARALIDLVARLGVAG
jgi:hypothetical protein